MCGFHHHQQLKHCAACVCCTPALVNIISTRTDVLVDDLQLLERLKRRSELPRPGDQVLREVGVTTLDDIFK